MRGRVQRGGGLLSQRISCLGHGQAVGSSLQEVKKDTGDLLPVCFLKFDPFLLGFVRLGASALWFLSGHGS